jgi:hypothetical protein
LLSNCGIFAKPDEGLPARHLVGVRESCVRT